MKAPIRYAWSVAHDPVAQLQQRLDRGEIKLTHDPERGYLDSLLRALKIPASSQGLVFSKTSFQHEPDRPSQPQGLVFQ